jgi:hypothetical protein
MPRASFGSPDRRLRKSEIEIGGEYMRPRRSPTHRLPLAPPKPPTLSSPVSVRAERRQRMLQRQR